MQDLIARAESIARRLKDRGETVVVAESSTGGLISAALLALPGASAYFLAGAVVYTQSARRALLDLPDLGAEHARLDRALCAAVGANRATTLRGELGAGRERSHRAERQSLRRSAGHTCIAVAGPIERSTTLETGSADRVGNMQAF